MLTPLVQRWRDRRGTYRPAGEVINTRLYEVAAIKEVKLAGNFVQQHHYSGTVPTCVRKFGLYERGALVGVAIFSAPQHDNTLLNVFPTASRDSLLELSRFVLLDAVAANGESWFHARARALLRAEGFVGYVAFADDIPRTDAAGQVIFSGHIGTHYQSSNAVFLGRGTGRTLRLFADGRVYSDRTAQKVRAAERGWRHAAAQLEAAGAPPCPATEQARRAWLRRWRIDVTRGLKHPGPLKYCFTLDKRLKLPAGLPYPKFTAAQLQPQLF